MLGRLGCFVFVLLGFSFAQLGPTGILVVSSVGSSRIDSLRHFCCNRFRLTVSFLALLSNLFAFPGNVLDTLRFICDGLFSCRQFVPPSL